MSEYYDFYVSDLSLFFHFFHSEFSIRVYRLEFEERVRFGLLLLFHLLAAVRETGQSSSARLFCNDVVMLTELRIGRRLLLLLKFQ